MKLKDIFKNFFDDFNFKKTINSFKDFVKNQSLKSKEDQEKNVTAILLTIIIVLILIFTFWKVPFLHKLIFP